MFVSPLSNEPNVCEQVVPCTPQPTNHTIGQTGLLLIRVGPRIQNREWRSCEGESDNLRGPSEAVARDNPFHSFAATGCLRLLTLLVDAGIRVAAKPWKNWARCVQPSVGREELKRNFSTASSLPVQYLWFHLNPLGGSLKLGTCGLMFSRLSAISMVHRPILDPPSPPGTYDLFV